MHLEICQDDNAGHWQDACIATAEHVFATETTYQRCDPQGNFQIETVEANSVNENICGDSRLVYEVRVDFLLKSDLFQDANCIQINDEVPQVKSSIYREVESKSLWV